MAGLIQTACTTRAMLERDGTQVENQFKGGRLAVWIGGPWVLGSVERTDDDELGQGRARERRRRPDAGGPGGKGYTFVGGSNLMMFKSTKHKNEAWALIKYLSEDAGPEGLRDLLGMFPARLAPQKQVGESDDEPRGVLRGDPAGPDVRADPAVGPDRERLQDALREHPRLARPARASPTARARCKPSSTTRPRRPTRCWPRGLAADPRPSVGGRDADPASAPRLPAVRQRHEHPDPHDVESR